MNDKLHPFLQSLIPVVNGIAKTFGKNCEVVLHDLSKPQSSIVAIANGHVTGRQVGGPMSDFGLKIIRAGEFDKEYVNYKSKSKDGKVLKSTTIFIKDENGNAIGCLCINLDVSEMIMFRNILNEFCEIEEREETQEDEPKETFGRNINEVLANIVNTTIENYGKPVNFMTKEEKVNIVKMLDAKGTFLIKGAIDYVAKVLCVSRYTIYNYLDEIRIGEEDWGK